jgi:hypothetical protein
MRPERWVTAGEEEKVLEVRASDDAAPDDGWDGTDSHVLDLLRDPVAS